MAPPSRILCAIDFSTLGDGALSVARKLAEVFEVPLSIAHVYETPWYAYPDIEVGGYVGAGDPSAVEGWFREKAGRLLETRLADLGEGAKGDVLEGSPIHRVLRDHAAAIGANLIVVGTHGRSAPGRYLLGSVAETLVRSAGVPLLVVPEGAASKFLGSQRVLCATDFSEPSEDGQRQAAAYAHALHGTLDLLHIEASEPGDAHRHESERLLGYEAQNLRNKYPGLEVHTHVRYGEPSSTIAEHATDHGTGMIVLGTRGTTGLARVLIGSVTDRVIRKATVPVLAIPPKPAG
ncbi:MAG: universal stress protein [Myxococcales bacterium]|nr:universal stress protein [Myxococcales bacterium]